MTNLVHNLKSIFNDQKLFSWFIFYVQIFIFFKIIIIYAGTFKYLITLLQKLLEQTHFKFDRSC